jgi:hypothetical protein
MRLGPVGDDVTPSSGTRSSPTEEAPLGTLRRASRRRFVLAMAVPATAWAAMFLWGLSWGWYDFPECASGSYFLYDFVWTLEGLAGALVVGAIAAVILGFGVHGLTGLLATLVMVILIGTIAENGARIGVENAGCQEHWAYFGPLVPAAWLTGLAAVGAIPAYLITLVIRRVRGSRSSMSTAAG